MLAAMDIHGPRDGMLDFGSFLHELLIEGSPSAIAGGGTVDGGSNREVAALEPSSFGGDPTGEGNQGLTSRLGHGFVGSV